MNTPEWQTKALEFITSVRKNKGFNKLEENLNWDLITPEELTKINEEIGDKNAVLEQINFIASAIPKYLEYLKRNSYKSDGAGRVDIYSSDNLAQNQITAAFGGDKQYVEGSDQWWEAYNKIQILDGYMHAAGFLAENKSEHNKISYELINITNTPTEDLEYFIRNDLSKSLPVSSETINAMVSHVTSLSELTKINNSKLIGYSKELYDPQETKEYMPALEGAEYGKDYSGGFLRKKRITNKDLSDKSYLQCDFSHVLIKNCPARNSNWSMSTLHKTTFSGPKTDFTGAKFTITESLLTARFKNVNHIDRAEFTYKGKVVTGISIDPETHRISTQDPADFKFEDKYTMSAQAVFEQIQQRKESIKKHQSDIKNITGGRNPSFSIGSIDFY